MAFEPTTRKDQKAPANKPSAAPATASRSQAQPAYLRSTAVETAPGVMELQGMQAIALPEPISEFLHDKKKALVNVRFGKLATGQIEVTHHRDSYGIRQQALPLTHPLLKKIGEIAPELEPSLVVMEDAGHLHGYVGVKGGVEISRALQQNAELLGLTGFHFRTPPNFTNRIENGVLHLAVKNASIRLGSAFDGTLTMEALDDAISFSGSVAIRARGVVNGTLDLQRSKEGMVTGSVILGLQLTKNLSGMVIAAWDGHAVSGIGIVKYQGEKLSGFVTLHLMEKNQARQLELAKKNPPEEPVPAPPAAAPAKDIEYVVFGEGDLAFAFNEWLQGTAHGIIDSRGYVTLVTKITPQAELPLFQKDYSQPIGPPIEVKATWGLPVIADVAIGAGGSLTAFAHIKGIFYKIEVDGDYSTDPEKAKDFSFQGTLNVTADAGLTLSLYVFAELEILAHTIRAKGDLDGTAGIVGVVEATPIIGYRENAVDGEDKKGEFFLKGTLDVAAQPYLGLSGNVSITLSTPWWSPLHDRYWPWELGRKVWPIGGSFGFGASVDYVFGSGQWPSLSFGPSSFSASDLLSGLIHEQVADGSSQHPSAKAPWHEHNHPGDAVPPKTQEQGKAIPAKVPPPVPPKRKGGGGAQTAHPADPKARVKDGRTVEELQQEAARQGKGPQSGSHETPDKCKTDTSGSKAARETGIGKEVDWKAEGESHRMWIETHNGRPEVMIASTTTTVAAQLAEYTKAANAMPAKKRKPVLALISSAQKKMATLAGDIEKLLKARNAPKKPAGVKEELAVEADEKALSLILEDIETALGLKGTLGSKDNPIAMEWPKPRLSSYPHIYLGPPSSARIKQEYLRDKDFTEIEKGIKDKEDRKQWIAAGRPIKTYRPDKDRASQPLPGGENNIGVDAKYRLDVGTKICMTETGRTGGGGKMNDLLRPYGYDPMGEVLQADHVLERQLGGEDSVDNLWPLNSTLNGTGGSTLRGMSFPIPSGQTPVAHIRKPRATELTLADIKTQVDTDSPVWFRIVSTRG